jgi:dTMP kinase
MLVRRLQGSGIRERRILWTREPGDWDGGAFIREILLNGELAHPLSELFLFLLDRCEHVRRVILPVLAEGGIVVCERYTDSTLAYQSWGRGIPAGKIEELFSWCDFPVPDRTFWLDLPVEIAYQRMSLRGTQDRFEAEGVPFLQRVRSGFASLAARAKGRIIPVDAEVEQTVLSEKIFSLLEVS